MNIYGKKDLQYFRKCEISGQMGKKTRNHLFIVLVSLFFSLHAIYYFDSYTIATSCH